MSDHAWVRPYLGVPFEEENCWELCRRALREQRGIDVPDYADLYDRGTDPTDPREAARREEAMRQATATAPWRRVAVPEAFDFVLFRMLGYVLHCALVIDGRLALSSRPPIGGHLMDYRQGRFAQRTEGFYRHAGIAPAQSSA